MVSMSYEQHLGKNSAIAFGPVVHFYDLTDIGNKDYLVAPPAITRYYVGLEVDFILGFSPKQKKAGSVIK